MGSRKTSKARYSISDYLYDIEATGESAVKDSSVRSRKHRYGDFESDLKKAQRKHIRMAKKALQPEKEEETEVERGVLYTLIRKETGSMVAYNQQQHDFWLECMEDAKNKIDIVKQELVDQNVVAIVSMIVGAAFYGFISLLVG